MPVKSVDLLYVDAEDQMMTKATEGQTVQLRKGVSAGLLCKVVVEGSDFKPSIKVFMGDKDVTKMFKQNETMIKESQHGLLKWVLLIIIILYNYQGIS